MDSYWFLLALTLLAMEMAIGTFYMLVLAVAMAVAGVAAYFSAPIVWQLALAALTAITGTLLLRRYKKAPLFVDTSLDVGQTVQVLHWLDNGMARVSYRGAEWDGEPETADMPQSDTLYIKEMRGSTLILTCKKPH